MRYLVKNVFSVVRFLKNNKSKGGIIGKLVKLFLVGLVFTFLTWLLFGEALHPKQILLLPIYALLKAGG
ncbi:MAG: hypothetical protein ACLFQ8_01825 [Candidatus Aenigmatarchaeota archaeon]